MDGKIRLFWQHLYRPLDLIFRPHIFFMELSRSQDLRPALMVLGISCLLFGTTSLISHFLELPLANKPLWAIPNYRLFQALALPIIFTLGWLLCSSTALFLSKILRAPASLMLLLAVTAPALFMPLWLMLWPTELAISLGLLNLDSSGFPGLWIHHLVPTITLLYTLAMLSLAFWQALRLLVREAFAMAVLSLLPVLGLWAMILR